MSCERRVDAGAYALDALEPSEVRDFERHLQGCAACADHVAELAPVVDTLPMAAPQMTAPPALKGRIMAVVEAEAELLRAAGPEADRTPPPRSRRRWWPSGLRPLTAGLAVCSVLAAGAVATVVLSGGDESGGTTTLQAKAQAGATVHLVMDGDGRAQLVMHGMPTAPAGRVYQVWVARDGKPLPTDTLFDVPRDGRARVAIDQDMDGVRQVLVTDEPPGGSREPTRNPVVVAQLS